MTHRRIGLLASYTEGLSPEKMPACTATGIMTVVQLHKKVEWEWSNLEPAQEQHELRDW